MRIVPYTDSKDWLPDRRHRVRRPRRSARVLLPRTGPQSARFQPDVTTLQDQAHFMIARKDNSDTESRGVQIMTRAAISAPGCSALSNPRPEDHTVVYFPSGTFRMERKPAIISITVEYILTARHTSGQKVRGLLKGKSV